MYDTTFNLDSFCFSKKKTAKLSLSEYIATKILRAFTSLFPELCTCCAALFKTLSNEAEGVGLESSFTIISFSFLSIKCCKSSEIFLPSIL